MQQIPQRLRPKNLVQVQEMLHEESFRKTIVDCIPSQNPKKCKTFVPEPVGEDTEKVQRVALVAPPGKVGTSVLNHMILLAHRFNDFPGNNGPEIKVFQTSHVPPYGYGKSHGLTRIVKLMPDPLLLQVVDALEAMLEPGQTMEMITMEDLQIALLQIMRFHCRLSHVAAHTASLSIDVATLSNATHLEHVLQEFMFPEDIGLAAGLRLADNPSFPEETVDDDEIKVLSDQQFLGASLLTKLARTLVANPTSTDAATTSVFWTQLDQVLQEEMKRTKDQSSWPCLTFWKADMEPAPHLSTITKKLAQALSPDCDDPYVSCFVQKDKCEAAGDPICSEH